VPNPCISGSWRVGNGPSKAGAFPEKWGSKAHCEDAATLRGPFGLRRARTRAGRTPERAAQSKRCRADAVAAFGGQGGWLLGRGCRADGGAGAELVLVK